MKAKVVRQGERLAIVLPPDAVVALRLEEGSEVSLAVEAEHQRIVLGTTDALADVDEAFARQVAEFIEQYRPALEELAK